MPLIDILSTKPNEYLFLPKDSQWITDSVDQKSDVAAIQKLFEPDWLKAEKMVTKTASGRGLVYFFRAFDEDCVLRHYYRGGLIAKISKDKFIFKKLTETRPFQELTLLARLYAAGLNVPKPIAARLTRSGVNYVADIITGAIPRTQELHQQLQQKPIGQEVWLNIGAVLRKMHNLQACHYDINVKNILLQEPIKTEHSASEDQQVSIHLLDFDGCKLRQGDNWKSANLNRFKRSLEKQKLKYAAYYYEEINWAWIEQGYLEALDT